MNKKNNIILIVTDQHRKDSLGCYGNTICKTPNLDSLAADGVLFNNAYTTTPVCTPARSSIQTGLYPSKTGMETNIYCPGCRVNELIDTPRLLSRRLQEAGYSTWYTGKWHLGIGKDKENDYEYKNHYSGRNLCSTGYIEHEGCLPSDIGYKGDDFPGHGEGGYRYDQYRNYLKENNLDFTVEGFQKPGTPPGNYTDFGLVVSSIESTNEYFLVEQAIKHITETVKDNNPFYYQLNFWGPHNPQYAPKEFYDIYKNISIPKWPSFDEKCVNKPKIHDIMRRKELDWSTFETSLKHYYAFISSIDAQIGRFIEFLKKKNLYEDTIIMFMPDHGDSQGCHGGLENKSYHMYEETVHIPFIVKTGKNGKKNLSENCFVNTCDLYSTILAYGEGENAQTDFESDGNSLIEYLEYSDTKNSQNMDTDCVVTEGLGVLGILETQRMIRQGNMKYVFHAADIDELYDLETDPYEMNNLIDNPDYSKSLSNIKERLYSWMDEHNDDLKHDFRKMVSGDSSEK